VDEDAALVGEQTRFVVHGFESFIVVTRLLKALDAVTEVSAVRVRRFHRGTLDLTVEHPGIRSLGEQLGRLSGEGFELTLLETRDGRVEAEVVALAGEADPAATDAGAAGQPGDTSSA
jgi:hypothetical protein